MKLLTLDFETYYDDEVTLKKLNYTKYINHDLFKVYGAALKFKDDESMWITEPALSAFFKTIDWSDTAVIGHNIKFDAAILAKYGIYPKLYIDTLGMARSIIGTSITTHSLDSVAKHLGFLGKTKAEALVDVKGLYNPSEEQMDLLGQYAKDDVDETYKVFKELQKYFPKSEYRLLDWTIRIFSDPKLILDRELLREAHISEMERKNKIISELPIDPTTGVQFTKEQIISNKQFAIALNAVGFYVNTEQNEEKESFSFSKDNEVFTELMYSDNSDLANLVGARLALKSNIEETRAKNYMDVAQYGPWPVDLNYSGAMQTHRMSGGPGGGGNPQNLGRKSPVRRAIMAPEGYSLIVADLNAIELRVSMAITGSRNVVEKLKNGDDVYCAFAEKIFDRKVTKADKVERTVGKVAMLSLQYGVGAAKFQRMVKLQSGLDIDMPFAKEVVAIYRSEFDNIKKFWKACEACYDRIGYHQEWSDNFDLHDFPYPDGDTYMLKYNKQGILLPTGLYIKYPDLKKTWVYNEMFGKDLPEWTYRRAWSVTDEEKNRSKIYGGLVMENICQALASAVIGGMIIKTNNKYPVVMQVHDELVIVAPDAEVESAKAYVDAVMTTAPTWWPTLPLGVESHIVKRYGDAK